MIPYQTYLFELAGYVSPKDEVYSDIPNYIKDFLKQINEVSKMYGLKKDIYKFIDKKMPIKTITKDIEKARKELELQYS